MHLPGSDMSEVLREHSALFGAAIAMSVALVVGGLVLMPVLLTRMRSDYFVPGAPPADSLGARHPTARFLVKLLKNLLGVTLLLAGIVMLILPGQGVLTLLAALALLDLPGKRRVERAVARWRPVRRALHWLRKRAGRPPFDLD